MDRVVKLSTPRGTSLEYDRRGPFDVQKSRTWRGDEGQLRGVTGSNPSSLPSSGSVVLGSKCDRNELNVIKNTYLLNKDNTW